MFVVFPHTFRRRPSHGFTLVELMIVIAILALILAIAIPNYTKTRKDATRQICIEQLSQIESAKQIWGVENNKHVGDVANESDLIGPALYIKKSPTCPSGGAYDFGAVGSTATCTVAGHSI